MRVPLTIVFRADASVEIGSGHVMRCLTLADALAAEGYKCHFLCRDLAGHMMSLVTDRGHAVTALPTPTQEQAEKAQTTSSIPRHASWAGVPLEDEILQSRGILNVLSPDRVIVDHYALDARWEAQVVPRSTPIMVIDDLADRPHICDILLDQNLGRQAADYDELVPPHCKRLIGPDYALLRPEFAGLRDAALFRRKRAKLENVLITLGGIDRDDATSAVLEAVSGINVAADLKITVVMGQGAPWQDAVRAQAGIMPCPTLVLSGVSNMAELMANADLCIGAAGSTSWERCAMGLPTLLLVLADNQRAGATALAESGAGMLLNDMCRGPLEIPVLERAFYFLQEPANLAAMAKAAVMISDGKGCSRCIRQVQEIDLGQQE